MTAIARPRRRHGLPRARAFGAARRGRRRGRLQHHDDRLPGDPHRSLVPRPDRRHDLPADRQRRRQRRGRRVARSPFVEGFIVREYWATPSNWRAHAVASATTCASTASSASRASTRARSSATCATHGAQDGVISTRRPRRRAPGRARRAARPSMVGPRPGARGHLRASRTTGHEGRWTLERRLPRRRSRGRRRRFVVAYDFGIKRNILRSLVQRGLPRARRARRRRRPPRCSR